jgi:apolipoprotein N-acyltransferase
MIESLPLPASYGINAAEGVGLVLFSWSVVSLTLGICTGVWAACLSFFDSRWKTVALVPLYLLSGLVSLYAFNILTANSGSSNPPFYTAGFLGYALADNLSFLQAAAWGGIWTLTGIVITINVLLYLILVYSGPRQKYILGALVVMLTLVGLTPVAGVSASDAAATATIGFMSLGFAERDFPTTDALAAARQDAAISALKQIKAVGADIALVPEDVSFFAPKQAILQGVLGTSTMTIVHGEPAAIPGNGYVALGGYVSTNKEDTWVRNKMILVPNGEYLPSALIAILKAIGSGPQAEAFSRTHAITNGEIGYPVVVNEVRASLMFCSEILGPDFATQMKRAQHTNLLLIASSHSLFGNGPALETDALRFTRVQTVEAGLPSVTSTTGGVAFVLDKYGRVVSSLIAEPGGYAASIVTLTLDQ